jgi:cell division protein FtsB
VRVLAIIFVVLILALQYPMWLGKGGWLQVRELNRQIERQRTINAELKARNDELEAEVRDLKHAYDAIEERARSELGMVKRDEVFFMLQESTQPRAAVANPAAPASTASAPITRRQP